jgi:hypothetical protein
VAVTVTGPCQWARASARERVPWAADVCAGAPAPAYWQCSEAAQRRPKLGEMRENSPRRKAPAAWFARATDQLINAPQS